MQDVTNVNESFVTILYSCRYITENRNVFISFLPDMDGFLLWLNFKQQKSLLGKKKKVSLKKKKLLRSFLQKSSQQWTELLVQDCPVCMNKYLSSCQEGPWGGSVTFCKRAIMMECVCDGMQIVIDKWLRPLLLEMLEMTALVCHAGYSGYSVVQGLTFDTRLELRA